MVPNGPKWSTKIYSIGWPLNPGLLGLVQIKVTLFYFNFHPAFRNVVSSFIKYSLCFTFSVVANMQSSTNANTWLDSPFSIKRFCNIAAQQLPLIAKPKGARFRMKCRFIKLCPVYLLHFSDNFICQ